MQRFKSSEQAQGFLSAHSFIYGHFRPRLTDLPPPSIVRSAPRLSTTGNRILAPSQQHNLGKAPRRGQRRPLELNVTMPFQPVPTGLPAPSRRPPCPAMGAPFEFD